MTNPDNMVRVRARLNGRASVYEANGWAQAYSTGLLEGNGVTQNTSADMNVLVGGTNSKPDVVIATNPAGYKIALDLVSQSAVAITAPAANSRISSIVAYTDDLSLASTDEGVTGSPSSCGLIVVNGEASASPVAPTDTEIRAAITADGATGSQACYCVVATILVSSATTIITDSLITVERAMVGSSNIDWTTVDGSELSAEAAGTIVRTAQVDENQWIFLGEEVGNSTSGVTVSWDTDYLDLKFEATAQCNDSQHAYITAHDSSGAGLANENGVRWYASSGGNYGVSEQAWSGNNIYLFTTTAQYCRMQAEGVSYKANANDYRTWDIRTVRGGGGCNFVWACWGGAQGSNTAVRQLSFRSNGTFSTVRLAVWGRTPY